MPSLLPESLVTTLHHPGIFQTPAITGDPTKDTLTLPLARLPEELEHIMEKTPCVFSTPHGQDSLPVLSLGYLSQKITPFPPVFFGQVHMQYTQP